MQVLSTPTGVNIHREIEYKHIKTCMAQHDTSSSWFSILVLHDKDKTAKYYIRGRQDNLPITFLVKN